MLTDDEILTTLRSQVSSAVNYSGDGSDLASNRKLLIDYYNQEKFGDEKAEQSQYVTSDVYDVVEGLLPPLLRTFTQGKYLAQFESVDPDMEDEAKQKTIYANWIFEKNNGVQILRDMFWDALAQYSGTVKIYFDEKDDVRTKRYKGMSETELKKLELDDDAEFLEKNEDVVELSEGQSYKTFSAVVNYHNKKGRVVVENVPPNELIIDEDARNYVNPKFIGQHKPMTRSDIQLMGFDKDLVNSLSAGTASRTTNLSGNQAAKNGTAVTVQNVTNDKSSDIIVLGEYYVQMDVDEDGVAERWKIFMADNIILSKERADDHPFATIIPIPIPHKAIGTCPAAKVTDIQYLNSTLMRQALNNIYYTNFNRTVINDRIDMDQMLVPRPAGVIEAKGSDPVQGALQTIQTLPIINEIMMMKEDVLNQREQKTGLTRQNQGLDSESLNKTATGFQGLRDMGQMKVEMIERLFADGGLKHMFEKIVDVAIRHQKDKEQVKLLGQTMEVDPSRWEMKMSCRIDVGIGAGDRQEKINNLNYVYQQQKELKMTGSALTDEVKMYATLDRLISEIGLKDASRYFNDPEQPEEVLQAQNEQLKVMVEQMQTQLQNPLAEAEQVKANAELMKKQSDNEVEMIKIQQDNKQFMANIMVKLTELELKYNADVPGSSV